jgi:hypothetical protein
LAKILRGDGVSFPTSNRVVNAATVDIYDDRGNIIGFVTSVDETLSRQVQRVRVLSSEAAGRVIEMCPQTEDISVNVNGYSLYDLSQTEKGSLIHRLGSHMAAMKSLTSQADAFNLVKKETHPRTGQQVTDTYYDCWLTNFSRTRDIGRLVTLDRAAVQVGQKE